MCQCTKPKNKHCNAKLTQTSVGLTQKLDLALCPTALSSLFQLVSIFSRQSHIIQVSTELVGE